ncbi:response regulator [Temperatibacter marinus]|uniref:Response regulator n=1 Tax=Temperatibacter marinus TaxID=1456591 RepID=A0AA52EGJ9_9PROT|nr:response regulator [Temperatibacter marinus]WND03268.1 response regulator [Temperatibacter marinus]
MAKKKLLIIDDDPHFSGLLALKLKRKFEHLTVSCFDKEKVIDGYDIYVLDNDFRGKKCGADLAEEIRKKSPNSLVIILSATLEFKLLKRLVNCHAAGVFDKSNPKDIETLFALIKEYLNYTETDDQPLEVSLATTLKDIKSVLKEWNKKLHLEGLKDEG